MYELKVQIEKFLAENSPLIIVNTLTDVALLCLEPELEVLDAGILIKFESLNERGGNSITAVALQGYEEGAIYLENEEGNVMMLQQISLPSYNHYIKPQYFNSPDFDDLEQLKAHLKSEVENAR